jgi:hypothetical protein
MPQAIDLLRQEHRNISALLRTLEWQVAAFKNDSQPDPGLFPGFPDLYHHPKEDLVFAKLRERDGAAAKKNRRPAEGA